jgi:malonate-semialdehyde dehydrogenase (acetylating) / methylmalonate-semialdehyde dehydrogenase
VNLIRNFIAGEWCQSGSTEILDVHNPATAEVIGKVPLSPAAEVDAAIQAAGKAFPEWRRTPVTDRIQFLFKLKLLLQEHFEELSRTITMECGKIISEARGEIQRAIENVEVACGAPILLQGNFSEDIASGIDELMIRQPLGVCACICPFNFPGMIPFWFMPYALACGNTYLVKPSEKVPLTMQRIAELIAQTRLPKGVFNLINGARETVDAIVDHPGIRAISLVGSSPVAKHVYARAAAQGKRAQCQGGAKNPIIILPDADPETTIRITADSGFGCAGQRCLAASLVLTVGEARKPFTEALVEAARSRKVGYGLDEQVQMGPVITPQSKARVESLIGKAIDEGATALVDGRKPSIPGYERGNFVKPTVLDNINPHGEVIRTEIFGPVLGLLPVNTVDEAIAFVNTGAYGNMACLFTSSGASARKFRYETEVGNVGINIGVSAPMAFFPFSGARESFFGDLHGQGRHAIEFFTQTKVVIERWPKPWTRTF